MSGPHDSVSAADHAARGSDLFKLRGRTALVTGGGKGLGLAMARALAGQGAAVCLSGRHEDVLRDACAEIARETGAPATFVVADQCERSESRRLAEAAVAALGRIDTLVTPAGLWSFSPRRGDWSRLAPPGCFGLVWGGDAVFFARRDSPDEVPHRVDLATSVIAPLPGYAKDALPYADQRNPGWTIFDDLLFFPSPVRGRTAARDASGVEHSWSQGSGCHGRVIHRVGDELVIFDEFGSRPQMIRRRRPTAADDRPQPSPP